MSFNINWEFLDSDGLQNKARAVFKQAMNRGTKPDVIVDDIELASLFLGRRAPSLEVLEIGDIDTDRFRGIFKLEYNGDAHVLLRTRIEANPLALVKNRTLDQSPLIAKSLPKMNVACKSLILPLKIMLSEIRLSAIVIVVYSVAKGLTLVFQNDPLQSVNVQSTFDFMPGIADFIRSEIEIRLRESFRDDIPEVLYQLSQTSADFTRVLASVKQVHDAHMHAQKQYDNGYEGDTNAWQRFEKAPSRYSTRSSDISDSGIAHDGVFVGMSESSSYSSSFDAPTFVSGAAPSLRLDDSIFLDQNTFRLDTPGMAETVSRGTLRSFEKVYRINRVSTRFDKNHKPKRRVIKLSGKKVEDEINEDIDWAEPPPTYKK